MGNGGSGSRARGLAAQQGTAVKTGSTTTTKAPAKARVARPPVGPMRSAPSSVRVDVEPGIQKATRALFGRDVTPHELAGLVGVQSDAYVHVHAIDKALIFDVVGRGYNAKSPLSGTQNGLSKLQGEYMATRGLRRTSGGKLELRNYGFGVHPGQQGQGIGARVFADQVRAAQQAGISRIVTEAARMEGGQNPLNGYYTWARLGYNVSFSKAPPELRAQVAGQFGKSVRTLQDLMAKPGGPAWWKQHGQAFTGTFDLKPGSKSLRALDAYLRQSTGKGL